MTGTLKNPINVYGMGEPDHRFNFFFSVEGLTSRTTAELRLNICVHTLNRGNSIHKVIPDLLYDDSIFKKKKLLNTYCFLC